MFLRPRPILASELSDDFIASIMIFKPGGQIVRVADIESSCRILNDVRPEHHRMAPEVGFEPTTNRLTADRSTTELLWIAMRSIERR